MKAIGNPVSKADSSRDTFIKDGGLGAVREAGIPSDPPSAHLCQPPIAGISWGSLYHTFVLEPTSSMSITWKEACQKCRLSGLNQNLMNQNLHFSQEPVICSYIKI